MSPSRPPVGSTQSARTAGKGGRIAASAVFFVILTAIVILMSPAAVQSQDAVPRDVLENMARSQYDVLCGSDVFVTCMGFSESACQDLADTAIEQCLLPLPEEIDPSQLDNDSIESCPKLVFEDAGFSDEKAASCFVEAIEGE